MLLLACCLLLLAAKPGRSTLDTKKGYKTKTGSTSSVTLTLTLAPTLALARLGSEFVLGSKMESKHVAKAHMNEFWGKFVSLINIAGVAEPARCKGEG